MKGEDQPSFGAFCGFAAGLSVFLVGLAHDRALANPFDLPKELSCGLLGLACLTVWTGTAWARQRGAVLRVGHGVLLSAMLAAAVGLVCTPPNAALGDSLLRGLGLFSWLIWAGLALSSDRALGILLAFVCGLGTVVAALGLLQHWGLDSASALGIWLPAGDLGSGRGLFESLPATDRPGSVFGHVNVASEIVALGCGAGLAKIRAVHWAPRTCLTLSPILTLMMGFLVLGGSRAAWLAVGISLLLVLPWPRLWRARRRVLLVAVLLAPVLVLADWSMRVPGRGATPEVRPSERLFEAFRTTSGTQRERRVLWSNTQAMIAERPWTGHGAGSWAVTYPSFARAKAIHVAEGFSVLRQPERAHQDWLQLAAEFGLPYAVLLALLWMGAILLAWRRGGFAGFGSALILLMIAIFGAFAFPMRMAVPALLSALLLGSNWAREGRVLVRCSPRALGAAALIALLISIWAAFAWRGRFVASEHLAAARQLALLGTHQPAVSAAQVSLSGRAVARAPMDASLWLRHGRDLIQAGRGDEARRAFQRALALRPHHPNARLALAQLAMLRREWAAAHEHLEKAKALLPQSPEVRFAYCQLLASRARDVAATRPRLTRTLRTEAQFQLEWIRQRRAFHPQARLLAAELALEDDDAVRAAALLEEAAVNTASRPGQTLIVARAMGREALRRIDAERFGRAGSRTLGLWARAAASGGQAARRAKVELALAAHLAAWEDRRSLPTVAESTAALQTVETALGWLGVRDLTLMWDRVRLLERLGRRDEAGAAARGLAQAASARAVADRSAYELWRLAEAKALALAVNRSR